MKSLLRISLMLFTFWTSNSAFAGQDRGGGGGIQIGDKFYTLAEAGLTVTDTKKPYLLDTETLKAASAMLEKIEKVLPYEDRPFLRQKAFSAKHVYKKLAVMDSQLFNEIKAKYQKYVDALPVIGEFKLVAYTGADKITYILPDWDQASLESRVLFLLAHEAPFFVNPQFDLEDILRFEVAIYEFNTKPEDPTAKFNLYKSMNQLKLVCAFSCGRDDYGLQVTPEMIDKPLSFYLEALDGNGVTVKLKNLMSPYDLQEFALQRRSNTNFNVYTYTNTKGWRNDFYSGFALDTLVLNASSAFDSQFFMELYGRVILLPEIESKIWNSLSCSNNPTQDQTELCIENIGNLHLSAKNGRTYLLDSASDKTIAADIHFISAKGLPDRE